MKAGPDRAQELETKLEAFLKNALANKADMDKLAAHYQITGLYQYSLRNQLLIMFQGGTICNSYKRWQKMKRQVRLGEKARIEILRPASRKIVEENEETGEKEEKWVPSNYRFFCVKVFDISQTDGEPLQFEHNSVDNDKLTFTAICQTAETIGFPVEVKPLAPARGSTDGKRIVISEYSNETDRIKTTFHELGHCLLGHSGKHDVSQSAAEVEAEAVSYLCLSALGIEYELAADYVQNWGSNKADVRTRKIVSAANKILKTIAA